MLCVGQGQAVLGTVDEVITEPILSTLYGAPMDVVRHAGRTLVIAGRQGCH